MVFSFSLDRFLFFPEEFLTIFLQQREAYFKADRFLLAFCANFSPVQFHDFFRNCKAEAGSAAFGGSGRIQSVKLFENSFQLFFWNWVAVVLKNNSDLLRLRNHADFNRVIFKAVVDCVFHKIVKYALHFIYINADLKFRRSMQNTA